jgi:tRNA G18 (ribose-2'-O)-methylase SpoU
MTQRNHYNTTFKTQEFPITLVCDHVTNAPNIGSLFRISDAFGVAQLILCGTAITLGRKVSKTARATEKIVNFMIAPNALEVVTTLKTKGYQIIALEITTNSTPIHQYSFSKNQPIALVIGDENFGVSDAILKLADATLHITMFGQNSSMNVVQATNIALYEMTKQFL